MEIIRQFQKMGLWDFIDLMKEKCYDSGDSKTYFMYLDEIKMRRIESISEGGNYKLMSLARDLLKEFEKEHQKNSAFCSDQDLAEFKAVVGEIQK